MKKKKSLQTVEIEGEREGEEQEKNSNAFVVPGLYRFEHQKPLTAALVTGTQRISKQK